jgi:fructose-1,6-bisphosphatase/inositol monophosphatase family enzyme
MAVHDSPDDLLALGSAVADAVAESLRGVADWAPAGARPGQYAIDLVADAAALAVLDRPGIGVLSEESGLHRAGSPVMAVVDPVDGSTNAAHRVPWFATSVCFVDGAGPLAAVVVNQGTGEHYEAVRGGGARRDGVPISPSGVEGLGGAVVALSGFPPRHLGWAQFRAFGAAALDLCSVADGRVDAFAVCGGSHLAPWDYLGGLLVCREAGAVVVGTGPGDLEVVEPAVRRALVAAGTAPLAHALRTALGTVPAGPAVAV